MQSIKIDCDPSPLLAFVKLLEQFGQLGELSLDVGDNFSELVRLETDSSPAQASEIVVRLYPSDRFLRLAAASLAREFDLHVVKDSAHID